MPTDPSKFRSMRPSAAHALAEIIDNVDEAADTAALVWKCDFEIELASGIGIRAQEAGVAVFEHFTKFQVVGSQKNGDVADFYGDRS